MCLCLCRTSLYSIIRINKVTVITVRVQVFYLCSLNNKLHWVFIYFYIVFCVLFTSTGLIPSGRMHLSYK